MDKTGSMSEFEVEEKISRIGKTKIRYEWFS